MVTVEKYAQSITQTSGSYKGEKYYREWTNLDNLKSGANWANCGVTSSNNDYTLIGGKTGTWNRPSTISLKNFGFNIPAHAKITRIRVGYTHRKNRIGGAYGVFASPTISLLTTSYNAKGYAVPTSSKSFVTTFSNVDISPSKINNGNFGVKINYPTNSSTNPAQIQLKDVWVEVTYTDFSFSISSSAMQNEEYLVGDSAEINLSLTSKTGNISSYASKVSFSLPSGVVFKEKTRGNGVFTVNGNVVTWQGNFQNTKSINVGFKVLFTTSGNKTLIFRESTTNTSTKTIFKVSDNRIELYVDYDEVINSDEEGELLVSVVSEKTTNTSSPVNINFPDNFEVSLLSGNDQVIFDGNNYVFTPELSEQNVSEMAFKIKCPISGNHTFTTVFENVTKNYNIKIKNSELTIPFFSKIVLDEKILDRLGDGKTYTVSSVFKLLLDVDNINLFDPYNTNYRLGVFNGEKYDDFTDSDYLDYTYFSESVSAPNVEEELSVDFIYHSEYPVIIFITGEYLEANARAFKIQYTYPCLMETEFIVNREAPGLFPYPIQQISSSDDFCVANVPSNKSTNPIRVYGFDVSGLALENNVVIQGVSVDFDVNCDSEFAFLMKLVINNKTGQRSINVNPTTDSQSIGGEFDLWGLSFDDFLDGNLDNFELELILLNAFNYDSYIELNNIKVTFHYIEVEESLVKCRVNGKDVRYYNMFLNTVKIPAGTENEVKYLDVDGTDSTIAYRSSIQKKEIEIGFSVFGCTITETAKFLERIGRLFANERDKFNKPILNTIEFSHYPDRIWEFITEDAIDVKAESADYDGTIKLIVPSGTSINKNMNISNAYGVNNSIAKVNPEIYVFALENTVVITEDRSNQELIIRGNNIVNKLLRIDCSNREAYLLEDNPDNAEEYVNINITSDVDINCDWFVIQGEYSFNCNNTANIQSVRFFERW